MAFTQMRSKRLAKPIKILQSAPPPDGNAAYVDPIVTNAPADLRFEYFSWRKVLLERWDVFHVHWPEVLTVSGGASGLRAHVLFVAMLVRLKLSGTKIVRTLHNVEPHEGSKRAQQRLLRILERNTDWFVRLNPLTDSPAPERTSLIPHGDYRQAFAKYERSSSQRGRVLYFGLIRPYKGVEELMETFIELKDDSLSLHVVGRAKGGAGPRVLELADRDPRIVTDLRYVDDATLVREVSAAQLVVLPYRNMHNSGALLAALSLDRPVLAPASPVNEWIADEVGEGWLTLYSGELDAPTLARALEQPRTGGARPRFRDRDWAHMSVMHADLYRRLVR